MENEFDVEYTFGRPAATYLDEHQRARLLLLRSRLQDSMLWAAAGAGIENAESAYDLEPGHSLVAAARRQ